MAYDEQLAARVRELLAPVKGITEKKMFGGLAFLHHGNMLVGLVHDDLMARIGGEAHQEALAKKGARVMDFGGRPMVGMVFVAPEGTKGAQLRGWIDRAFKFVSTLPPKAKEDARPRPRPRAAAEEKRR